MPIPDARVQGGDVLLAQKENEKPFEQVALSLTGRKELVPSLG